MSSPDTALLSSLEFFVPVSRWLRVSASPSSQPDGSGSVSSSYSRSEADAFIEGLFPFATDVHPADPSEQRHVSVYPEFDSDLSAPSSTSERSSQRPHALCVVSRNDARSVHTALTSFFRAGAPAALLLERCVAPHSSRGPLTLAFDTVCRFPAQYAVTRVCLSDFPSSPSDRELAGGALRVDVRRLADCGDWSARSAASVSECFRLSPQCRELLRTAAAAADLDADADVDEQQMLLRAPLARLCVAACRSLEAVNLQRCFVPGERQPQAGSQAAPVEKARVVMDVDVSDLGDLLSSSPSSSGSCCFRVVSLLPLQFVSLDGLGPVQQVPAQLHQVIRQDLDIDHSTFLAVLERHLVHSLDASSSSASSPGTAPSADALRSLFSPVLHMLLDYVEQVATDPEPTKGSTEAESPCDEGSFLLLKQQRAIVVLGDVLWRVKCLLGSRDADALADVIDVERVCRATARQPAARDNIRCALMQIHVDATHNTADAYAAFMNQFLSAANERELLDFERCAQTLLRDTPLPDPAHVRLVLEPAPPLPAESSSGVAAEDACVNAVEHVCSSGMRIGISSANASDNWTNAKLRGGDVVNVSVNLDGEVPMRASLELLHQPVVVLASTDRLVSAPASAAPHVSVRDVEGGMRCVEAVFSEQLGNLHLLADHKDPTDHLRMLKAALFFTRIFSDPSSSSTSACCFSSPLSPSQASAHLATELSRFTQGHGGFRLSLINRGPSRSGFASSSAVAFNLLKLLYCASGQYELATANQQLIMGSMVLLFENRLGLKSGRQDVDGLLPNGLKLLHYGAAHSGDFLCPRIEYLPSFPFEQLPSHIMLVDTGIPRAAHLDLRRGLNMRHWALLSRDSTRFPALRRSYAVHRAIVECLSRHDWPRLGQLFLKYMALRETMDPGATASVLDYDCECDDKDSKTGSQEQHESSAAAGGTGEVSFQVKAHVKANANAKAKVKVLRLLFDPLLEAGLIHGGMFTGAMGGGVAMLVLTPQAHLPYEGSTPSVPAATPANANGTLTRIQHALRQLQDFAVPTGARPFEQLKPIVYSVNTAGVRYEAHFA